MAAPKAVIEPVIDGVIDPEEWSDALQLGLFYHAELVTLAPEEIATVLYLKWDDEALYVAMRGKLYPEGTSVRAAERRYGASDGIIQGDHAFFELFPLADRSTGNVSRTGSFTWLWNPLGAFSDHHLNIQPGQRGGDWISDATLANRVTETHWESEMRIPLENLKSQNITRQIKLPPSHGDSWSFHAARRFGRHGDGIDLATTPERSVFTHRNSSDWAEAWATLPALRLSNSAVALHLETLGDLTRGLLEPVWSFHNSSDREASVSIDLVIRDSEGETVFEFAESVNVPAGETVVGPVIAEKLTLEPSGMMQNGGDTDTASVFLRIRDDQGNFLYIGPPAPFFVFNDLLRTQFQRALQILRE